MQYHNLYVNSMCEDFIVILTPQWNLNSKFLKCFTTLVSSTVGRMQEQHICYNNYTIQILSGFQNTSNGTLSSKIKEALTGWCNKMWLQFLDPWIHLKLAIFLSHGWAVLVLSKNKQANIHTLWTFYFFLYHTKIHFSKLKLVRFYEANTKRSKIHRWNHFII